MKGSIAAVAALAVLAGCTATGEVRDPAVRRLTWFSYVSGDDMQCETGLERLRLVQNAIWDEDVRVIDVVETPGAGYAVRELRFRNPDWSEVSVDLANPSLPWRGEEKTGTWSAAEMQRVSGAVAADGGYARLDKPVELEGQGFFWTLAACKDGAKAFHAWAYPSEAYAKLGFPAVVAPLTPSREPFAQAHPKVEDYPNQNRKALRDFGLKAEADGVSGRFGLAAPPLNRFLP